MTRLMVMYTVLYMSERTQIYLTSRQRRKLDEIAASEGKSLAQVIRDAVEVYVARAIPDASSALQATFGAAPDITTPDRGEWERTGTDGGHPR